MRTFVLTLFTLPFVFNLTAQTVISGITKDTKGRIIPGVSITVKDTYDGGTSDSTGYYTFKTSEKDTVRLVASSIGYFTLELKITLTPGNMPINFALKEEPNELKAVVITAGSFEASDTKRATALTSIDIVTTAGGNGDITGAIKTLPGAQQVGESEGLFVRGGTAGETKVFIDGTLVNNYFFSSVPDIAQRGRFSPFLFKGTVFSSGGYSAQYGQALSSVLLLESIDLPDKTTANLGISTVGLSGGYQRLSKNKKSSWGVNYNYTDLQPSFAVIKQKPDYFQVPQIHGSDFNFRIKTSSTGMLKFYGLFNGSRLGLRKPDIDSTLLKSAFGLKNLNYYGNLSWKEQLGKQWRINAGISYSNNSDRINSQLQNQENQKQAVLVYPFSQKNFDIEAKSELVTARAVFERRLTGLSMFRIGGEYFYSKDNSAYSSDSLKSYGSGAVDHLKAAFVETDVYLTNDLAAKIGVRAEQSSLLDKANLAPRISMAYKIGEGQATLAYGIFYQKPENSFFTRSYHFNDLQYTRAAHYIANYQIATREHTLRAEVFYKKYHNLIKTMPFQNSTDSLNNKGYGDAKGFELFWRDKKTIPNMDYWISYSYLDTKRDYLNYPKALDPSFAARHTASLVVKKFVTKLKTQFNASYTFATGRPYYNIRYDYANKGTRIFDEGRTINYNAVGVSLNYLPNISNPNGKRFAVFVLSVTNVFGNKQVYGYNYSFSGSRKEAVTPPSKRFIFLGCFISFGEDRSDDIINSNL